MRSYRLWRQVAAHTLHMGFQFFKSLVPRNLFLTSILQTCLVFSRSRSELFHLPVPEVPKPISMLMSSPKHLAHLRRPYLRQHSISTLRSDHSSQKVREFSYWSQHATNKRQKTNYWLQKILFLTRNLGQIFAAYFNIASRNCLK